MEDHKGSRRRETSYIKQNERGLTALVTSCVGGAFIKSLLKKTEGMEHEEEDVSRYWKTLLKGELTGI